MKFAQKFTAGYIQGEYQYSAWSYLKDNPVITTIRMIDYSAVDTVKGLEAQKAAAGFLHYFESLETTHDATYDLGQAMSDLATLIATGTAKAQELGNVIDKNYKFDDER